MAKTASRCAKCGASLPEGLDSSSCPWCLLRVGISQSSSSDDAELDAVDLALQEESAGGSRSEPSRGISPPDDLIGKRLGGYRVVDRLAEGGMGVVYRAWEETLRRTVALKVPSKRLSGDPGFAVQIERFREEARAAASLSHPNICPIFAMGEEHGVHYFAMEYVRGVSLLDHVRRYGPLEPRRALEIASQVASALATAHGAGLIHRDIKPSNIMLVREPRRKADESSPGARPKQGETANRLPDEVRVMDFGLAKWAEAEARLSTPGKFLGTLAYASPEQCEGRDLDGRSDLYSLGVVLYEALTGRLPYKADTPASLVREIRLSTPPPLREVLPGVPPEFEAIIRRLLAKNPEARFASAVDLWGVLQETLGRRDAGRQPGMVVVVCVGATTGGEANPANQPDAFWWLKAAEEVVQRFPEAERMEVTEHEGLLDASGFVFERPSEAVRFALLLRLRLEESGAAPPNAELPATGIHLGEMERASGGNSVFPGLRGAAVDGARGVMHLATSGQLLMTLGVFDAARQAIAAGADALLLPEGASLRWLAHGPYVFGESKDPVGIAEVGIEGISPLEPPPDSGPARKAITAGEHLVLGWRPALGLGIPQRRHWALREKRGEGGFGEVWLAEHAHTHEKRVFKFCFEAERVRSLKREVTLFRLLKETLGQREDITKLIDWQFETAPYFIESPYTEEGSLAEWAEHQGGIGHVSLEDRVEIVAQTASAVAAAHSVGVLHKDIKPGNILIGEREGQPHAMLTDFGLGLLTRRDALGEHNITQTGLTGITLFADESPSSAAGTRIYMAPELFAGGIATTRSDVFALGVLLYQMVAGDLSRALTVGWRRHIDDDLLREDILRCVEGEPEHRLISAAELADRLRSLPERRERRERRQRARLHAAEVRKELERARRRRKAFAWGAVAAAAVIAAISFFALREQVARHAAEKARQAAEQELYYSDVALSNKLFQEGQYASAIKMLWQAPGRFRNWEWGCLLNMTHGYDLSLEEHQGPVVHCEFDTAGQRLITASRDGTARVWDPETGETLLVLEGHDGPVNDAVFSPNGNLVATVSDDGTACIWDSENGEQILVLSGHSGPVNMARFAPSGRRLLTTSKDGTARVSDVSNGEEVFLLKGHERSVDWGVFSPDGARIATGAGSWGEGRSILWDAATGEQLLEIDGFHPRFSPDARRVAVLTTLTGVSVLDAENGRHITGFRAHPGGTLDAVFSPDGRWLATCGEDNISKLWDTKTWQVTHVFEGHAHFVTAVAFAPNGDRLATASLDGSTRIWDVVSGEEVSHLLGHRDAVTGVSFDATGRRLATASSDTTAMIWTCHTGEDPCEPYQSAVGTLSQGSFAFHPDGLRMACRRGNMAAVVDAPTGIECVRLDVFPVGSVAFSLDGRLVATGGTHGTVTFYDAETGEKIRSFSAHDAAVFRLRFSPDSRQLVTASIDRSAKVWDTETGRNVWTFPGHDASVLDAVFSPDGRWIVTVSEDRTARIWNAKTGLLECVWEKQSGPLWTADFTEDSSRVLIAGSRNARTRDLPTGKDFARFEGHGSSVWSAFFSPDKERVLTASWDQTVRVWAAGNGRELLALDTPRDPKEPCGWHAEFTPDGRRVFAASYDGVNTFWDAAPWRRRDLPGDSSLSWLHRFEVWQRSRREQKQRWVQLRRDYRDLLALEQEPLRTRETARRRERLWRLFGERFRSERGYANRLARQYREWYAAWRPPESAADVHAPGDADAVELGGGLFLEMAWVPSGEFVIGAPLEEVGFSGEESPPTWLALPGFWMGRCETTVAQFRRFVEETEYVTDAEKGSGADMWDKGLEGGRWWKRTVSVQEGITWREPGYAEEYQQTEQHPVVCVSWNDALAFCDWLSAKTGDLCTLPTEAQWEYACRAGSQTTYPWGESPEGGDAFCNGLDRNGQVSFAGTMPSFHWDDGFTFPAPVGSLRPNAWGLHDCLGNVHEICLSQMRPYPYRVDDGREDLHAEGDRVMRGGDAFFGAGWCRPAWRWPISREKAFVTAGFRVVRLAE